MRYRSEETAPHSPPNLAVMTTGTTTSGARQLDGNMSWQNEGFIGPSCPPPSRLYAGALRSQYLSVLVQRGTCVSAHTIHPSYTKYSRADRYLVVRTTAIRCVCQVAMPLSFACDAYSRPAWYDAPPPNCRQRHPPTREPGLSGHDTNNERACCLACRYFSSNPLLNAALNAEKQNRRARERVPTAPTEEAAPITSERLQNWCVLSSSLWHRSHYRPHLRWQPLPSSCDPSARQTACWAHQHS